MIIIITVFMATINLTVIDPKTAITRSIPTVIIAGDLYGIYIVILRILLDLKCVFFTVINFVIFLQTFA